MRILSAALIVAVISLSGCATTTGLNPSVAKSGFDGATVVNIEPHGNICADFCTTIGAQWSSKNPDKAILTISIMGFDKFHAIQGAQIRIGSDTIKLNPNPGLTSHKRESGLSYYYSGKDFTVPLDLVRRVIASNDVWIRLNTNDGMVDDSVIASGKDSKAYHALKRFVSGVDAQH